MEFFNRSYAQVRDLVISMTPGARLTAGLLAAVVVISLGFLFRQSSSSPSAFLFGGEYLSSSQLQRIEAAIAKSNLTGYEIESNRIRVPRGQEAPFMAAIAEDNAMPADFHLLLEKAISAGGVFGSKEDKRQQVKAAREHQLSLILQEMDGIEEAYVLFNESTERVDRSPNLKQRVVTASVNVRAGREDALDAQRVKMIRRLVASSIGGSPSDVTVADISGGRVFGGSSDGEIDATEHPYYQQQMHVERQVRDKIKDLLLNIPGVLVQVGVELDPMTQETTKDVKLDPKGFAVHSTAREEESINRNTKPGGLVGTQANDAIGPNGNGSPALTTAGATNENETSFAEEASDYLPSHTELVSRKIGLTPQRITATIRIPSDYWENVWRDKNKPADGGDAPAPSPDDLDNFAESQSVKIQDAVVALLGGKDTGENKYARVSVTTYHHSPEEPPEGPSLAMSAVAWVGSNWTTIGMMGIAMFSLVMLRSMVKSLPTGDAAPAAAATFEIEPTSDDETEEDPDRPRLRLRKGDSLKDDLGDIVREDPDAAASILRSWIGAAS